LLVIVLMMDEEAECVMEVSKNLAQSRFCQIGITEAAGAYGHDEVIITLTKHRSCYAAQRAS
jgi:hypothetical protein